VREFWVKTGGGAWTVLGPACSSEPPAAAGCYAPHALAARFPRVFQLMRLRVETRSQYEGPPRCVKILSYRGRVAIAVVDDECSGAAAAELLAGAVQLLGRLTLESDSPPSRETRLERARARVERCEAAEKGMLADRRQGPIGPRMHNGLDHVCDYALHSAAAQIAHAPADAVPLVLRVLSARLEHVGTRAGRFYLPEILRTLAAAGKGESREALWAHIMRVAEARDANERSESAAVVTALAPKLLAADDPLFAQALWVIGNRSDALPAGAHLAFLREWDAKAQSADPASDAAHKVRIRLCLAYRNLPAERPRWRHCADDLRAIWESRIAAGRPFDIFPEADLVMVSAQFYAWSAHDAQDFAAVLPTLRSIVQRAETRFSTAHFDYRLFWEGLRTMEAGIAAKAAVK
jgi:hypothetical protein